MQYIKKNGSKIVLGLVIFLITFGTIILYRFHKSKD
nr:MAG TPA: Protein of unknown function (DUF2659) [Caudoviricetes sp.]